MPIFLLTNDDGVASPMLGPLIGVLSGLGEVRVAVPLQEQSWRSKAMSRFGRVAVAPLPDFGVEGFTVAGTPADCVNLGVHNLFAGPPDWVVAGINIGANVGLSFTLNSGTVGAALEGALLGIPAVALSMRVAPDIYAQWSREGKITGDAGERAIAEAARGSERIMGQVVARGLPPGAMLLNVNFPHNVSPATPVRWTHLLENGYGSLFEKEGAGFRHGFQGHRWRAETAGNDWDVVEKGETSVTPLTFSTLTAPAGPRHPFE